jgi:hypothetical protein
MRQEGQSHGVPKLMPRSMHASDESIPHHSTRRGYKARQAMPLEEKRGPLKGSACFLTGLIARQPTTLNLDLGIHREDCGASNHRTAAAPLRSKLRGITPVAIKVHMTLWSFVVLAWLCETSVLVSKVSTLERGE